LIYRNLLFSIIFTLIVFANARADPIIIGDGSVSITNIIGVANWDALGLKVYFDLENTSLDPNLKLVSITSPLADRSYLDLNLMPNDSANFLFEFPTYWNNIPFLMDSVSITFANVAAVPEPISLVLFGSGFLLLLVRKRS
jgi:PEP-CTERM motif